MRLLGAFLLTALASCQSLTNAVRGHTEDSHAVASLEQAREAWEVMQREKTGTVAAHQAAHEYGQAVARVVGMLKSHEGKASWGREMRFGGPSPWRITFDPPARQGRPRTWTLSEFAQCRLASEVKLRGFDRVVAKDGWGVPVVLVQDDFRRVTRPFHPAEGEFLPATAVLEFPPAASGQPVEARLRFYNPLVVTQVDVGRRAQPLAENLTAALQFSLTEKYFDEEEGWLGAMSGGEEGGHLFFLSPYDPTKVPVVFLHGVRSYPGVWKNTINELFADPELRRRYQPVCFIYPPKMPVPASAASLRQMLTRFRGQLDPEHDDAVLGRVVLVGHSMGGLVARMQVIDSGMDFWRAFFTATPGEIARTVDGEALHLVQRSLIFRRQPDVKLAVFVCTPHRGSDLADYGIVRAMLRLVLFLPEQAQRQLKALQELPAPYIHPTLREFHAFGLQGQDNSSTKHPYFKALSQRPMGVPFHSIIAAKNGEDIPASSDGVVPYWSAHLDGAASETIVHHPHSCLAEPDTVQAVLRILKRRR